MDADAIIDQTMTYEENVGAADSNNTSRRARHLDYLIEAFTWAWTAREWPWRRRSSTATVAASTGYGPMPTDFSSIGDWGGVYHPTTNELLDWVDPQELLQIRRDQNGSTTDRPEVYSIFDQETAAPFELRLQIPTNTSQLVFPVDYLAAIPTIDESSNKTNTNRIPDQYHRSVLIPRMRFLIRDSHGQSDAAAWETLSEKGLRQMQREVLPPGSAHTQRLPSYFGG